MELQSQYGHNGSGIIYSTATKEYKIDIPKPMEKKGKILISLSPKSLKISLPAEEIMEEKTSGQGSGMSLERKVQDFKKSFTKYELAKQSLKAIVITGVGTGAIATFLFGYKVGIVSGILAAALNVHGVFYRNKHYSEYYSDNLSEKY